MTATNNKIKRQELEQKKRKKQSGGRGIWRKDGDNYKFVYRGPAINRGPPIKFLTPEQQARLGALFRNRPDGPLQNGGQVSTVVPISLRSPSMHMQPPHIPQAGLGVRGHGRQRGGAEYNGEYYPDEPGRSVEDWERAHGWTPEKKAARYKEYVKAIRNSDVDRQKAYNYFNGVTPDKFYGNEDEYETKQRRDTVLGKFKFGKKKSVLEDIGDTFSPSTLSDAADAVWDTGLLSPALKAAGLVSGQPELTALGEGVEQAGGRRGRGAAPSQMRLQMQFAPFQSIYNQGTNLYL